MRNRLMTAALAAFVVLDVLLVVLAVRHVEPATPSSTGSAPPAVAASSRAPVAQSRAPASTVRPSPVPAEPVRFLAAAPDGTIVRAPGGDCTRRATLDVGVGRGRSVTERRVSGLREVVGLRVGSRSDVTVVGLDARCRGGTYTSRDGGVSWQRGPSPDGGWHLSADAGAASVVSPAGPRRTPCPVRAVSAIDTGVVRVLCSDGVLLGTPDVGATWITLGRLAGAVDARFTTPGDGVALATQPDCPAAVLGTADGGTTWSRLTCLPGRAPRAVATAGDVVAAQVGRRLYVSTDGGTTWPGTGGG